MIALIDGDIVCYRAAASCEPTKAKQFLEPREVALLRAEDTIRRIIHETGADSYRIFIGGSDNYRYQIYPEYKANRKDTKRPDWLQDVREYAVTEHNAEICDGIEADDAMGIAQSLAAPLTLGVDPSGALHEQTTICSIDKDLLQVPGWHYNFVKQESQFVVELTGLRFFYQQLIQGDASDNIPGYDGKMRPKIPQFLQPHIDELWLMDREYDMYIHVLEMYNYDYDTLERNGKLLWIQRKEGDMWLPPKEKQDDQNVVSTNQDSNSTSQTS